MAQRITVVVSQGQSNHPQKRGLEEDLVAALLMEPGVEVAVIPNLYDLTADGTGVLALQGITGNMIIASWLYPRAAHWSLDRHGILGQLGETLLISPEDDEEDEDLDETDQGEDEESDNGKPRVIDQRELPQRKIYHLDLRIHDTPQPYVDEVRRIAAENNQQVVDLLGWVQGSPSDKQLQRFIQPTNTTALGTSGGQDAAGQPSPAPSSPSDHLQPARLQEDAGRRWYPVIDYSRCTNCMECIDFCLFGVYGTDRADTILVELPDNCRKGCPACSRVCPENAIIFPQHKTPAIAGAAVAGATLKIDLSQLFGAPLAVEVAAQERDEQLLLAGRDAVGLNVGIPKRQEGKPQGPKDELDNLIDSLDDLDL